MKDFATNKDKGIKKKWFRVGSCASRIGRLTILNPVSKVASIDKNKATNMAIDIIRMIVSSELNHEESMMCLAEVLSCKLQLELSIQRAIEGVEDFAAHTKSLINQCAGRMIT